MKRVFWSQELNGIFVDDSELRILLHTRQAGAVIGRKGNTVKELREVSQFICQSFILVGLLYLSVFYICQSFVSVSLLYLSVFYICQSFI